MPSAPVDILINKSKQSEAYPPSRLAGLKPAQRGEVRNPRGRPKGSRNKLGEDFLSAIQSDFAMHGIATIAKVREDRPHEYLRIVADLLPKNLNITTNPLEDLSDDELEASIQILLKMAQVGNDPDGAGSDGGTKH